MAIPSTMRAQLLEAFNTPYALRTIPVPTIEDPHDLLIRVDAASYCHTDAVLAAGQMPPNPPAFPHIGCHEFAGTVAAVGPAVRDVKPGDRVGVPGRAYHPCGACDECQTHASPDDDAPGYSPYCPRSKNNGISTHGGFREYALCDSRQIAPIPEELSAVETAPLMCAGLTVYAALKRCQLRPGQTVGISGCGGGLGHLGLQFAAAMGLDVVGIDAADAPLELARGLKTGARIYDARTTKAEDIIKDVVPHATAAERVRPGLDAVLILPESQRAFDYGVSLLKNHGRCIVVSFPKEGFHVDAWDLVFRDIRMEGSLVGSNKVLREMLRFAARHGIRAVVRTFRLEELNRLVEAYHAGGGGKLVVDLGEEKKKS